MKIFIDADGCPVVGITVGICRQHDKECIIVCDTSHIFEKDGAKTITVSKGDTRIPTSTHCSCRDTPLRKYEWQADD